MTGASAISAALDLPGLGRLDPTSREAIAAAGRPSELAAGAPVYAEGDPAESFYLVLAGEIVLTALRRGEAEPVQLRRAGLGDTFGEEATLPGLGRRADAVAGAAGASVLEVPLAVFLRACARSGSAIAEREQRYLERSALRDQLGTSALGADLAAADLEFLLDASRLERYRRGDLLYERSDRARDAYLVLGGLVQIQRDDGDGRVSVQAYLTRGDLVGEEEALAGAARADAAVAMGDTLCARIPGGALAELGRRRPGLPETLRRRARVRLGAQEEIVGEVASMSTRHVFRDLYRMQVARSLLVIDQDLCVRCGHCSWSCAQTHGVSRLTRRGDQMVARLGPQARPSTLLVPNSCQHCRHAACMVDCPTGAIGRDLGGDVFIRPELCTGCGNCAKACPWGNIEIAPRPGAGGELSADVAVKCDHCRELDGGPACVSACPTEAILRIDPSRDLVDVRRLLSGTASAAAAAGDDTPAVGGAAREAGPALALGVAAAAAIALLGAGFAFHLGGAWSPGSGAGLASGILAAALALALAGYGVGKRLVRRRGATRSKITPLRPRYLTHLGLGFAGLAAAGAHAGPVIPASAAGALYLALIAASLLGLLGAAAYALLPPRLSRLERRGTLPEDLPGERSELLDRLYRATSGANDLLKALADRILVPYARALLGPAALCASGRSLAEERRRLRARIDRILGDRGRERLGGLDEMIDVVVELRALPARRWLTRVLRGWLPLHIAASAVALALLGLHVVAVAW